VTYRPILRALLVICAVFGLNAIGSAHGQDHTDPGSERRILVMLKLAPAHFRPNTSYGGSYGDALSSAARRRVALGIARKYRMELVDSWPMPVLGVDCYVMRLPADLSVDAAIEQVSRNSMVEWSQPMQLYQTRGGAGQEGDPLFKAAPAASTWRLADLHRIATGRGVSVAVIDSKIETHHPDLKGQFAAVQDFVSKRPSPPEQHGTGVAGVIAAKANNGIGIAGVAPSARLMALRACWQTGSGSANPTLCNSLSLARALQYAIEHDAEVINLSLSGPPDPLLQKLIDVALASRTIVVAAFDPNLPKGGFPASQPGVIAVVEESLQSLPSQLYGAPGRNVPTTQPGGKWNLVNGSSYAAAHVSGLIALVRDKRRPASPAIAIARSSKGAIDACATLLRTSPACDCSCALVREMRATASR
jgi:subtilisin family serine protease